MRKLATAVLAALAAAVLAGCSSGSTTHAANTAHVRHLPTASPALTVQSVPPQTATTAPPPAVPAEGLTCSTVVDPDSGITARQAITDLQAMLLIDGTVNLSAGTPSQDDVQILQVADIDLKNYSGSQLASDATQFSRDEESYDPAGSNGGPYASDGAAVAKDILVLAHDCGTTKAAIKLAGT